MPQWKRGRGRRGKKKDVSSVEATGRIGQPKSTDPSKLQPLQPMYYDAHQPPAKPEAAPQPPVREQAPPPPALRARTPPPRKVEVETQPESPAVPPARPAEAMGQKPAEGKDAKKAPRGVVVLAIGLPGSGKTTWFKRRGVTPLSTDMLRTLLFDDSSEQRYQNLVFATLRSLLRARLIARMPWNYVDATNLSARERRQWIKMAKALGYEVQAVFFDVPLEVCLERNKKRERMVPEDVMQRMAAKLKTPTFEEGFSKVVVVRVKKKAGEDQAEEGSD